MGLQCLLSVQIRGLGVNTEANFDIMKIAGAFHVCFKLIFTDSCFDNYIVHKSNQNKCSNILSFTKMISALTEVLNNVHTHCERNIHAYHKNTNIYQQTFNEIIITI